MGWETISAGRKGRRKMLYNGDGGFEGRQWGYERDGVEDGRGSSRAEGLEAGDIVAGRRHGGEVHGRERGTKAREEGWWGRWKWMRGGGGRGKGVLVCRPVKNRERGGGCGRERRRGGGGEEIKVGRIDTGGK